MGFELWAMRQAKTLAAVVAHEFDGAKEEGESAGGKAAHGEHEAEPSPIGVRTLAADAAEDSGGKHYGNDSGTEDE